jgi:adenosylmethionine-8-amino-7-oxononanoate aminotransferase
MDHPMSTPIMISDTDATSVAPENPAEHLWMHFTRMSSFANKPVPTIERGEGAYIWDTNGRRYLDGLSGLFAVQVGHGRVELAEAAAAQARKLAFFPIWSYAHPTAIELADRLAAEAPGDLNKVFFSSGGGESVETAWKVAKQYFKLIGKPSKTKVISRAVAYHGTPHGALSITGVPGFRLPFEPLVPGGSRVTRSSLRFGQPIGWKKRSSRRDQTASQPCSSSRCKTPAVAFRPLLDISSGCERSVMRTTCCLSPMK